MTIDELNKVRKLMQGAWKVRGLLAMGYGDLAMILSVCTQEMLQAMEDQSCGAHLWRDLEHGEQCYDWLDPELGKRMGVRKCRRCGAVRVDLSAAPPPSAETQAQVDSLIDQLIIGLRGRG